MNPRIVWAIMRKDFLDIWLNKSTLGGLIYPIIMALSWLLISHLVGGNTTELVVYNPGNSSLVQVVEQAFPKAIIVLLLSLIIGTTFIPLLLLEEKEKRTLRILLVTPASFGDILAGKLLVVLVFQLVDTCVTLAILNSFTGAVPLVLLYVLLGALFSLSLGLLFGSLFNSVTTAGTVAGFVAIVYIIGGIFVGPLGQILGNGPVLQIARLLPTYYLAEGVVNASQNLGSWSSNLLDIGIILGSTIVLLAISAWALRRQSEVLAII